MTKVTSHDIEIALKELGDTLPDIYETLQELKIQGTSGNAATCPIAQYLALKLNAGFLVAPGRIGWVDKDDIGSMIPSEVISEFITRFDIDQYPRLIK